MSFRIPLAPRLNEAPTYLIDKSSSSASCTAAPVALSSSTNASPVDAHSQFMARYGGSLACEYGSAPASSTSSPSSGVDLYADIGDSISMVGGDEAPLVNTVHNYGADMVVRCASCLPVEQDVLLKEIVSAVNSETLIIEATDSVSIDMLVIRSRYARCLTTPPPPPTGRYYVTERLRVFQPYSDCCISRCTWCQY